MPIPPVFRRIFPALLLFAAACSDTTQPAPTPGAGTPARVAVVAGDAQLGTPGNPLAAPLTVLVADSAGRPVQGVSVVWTVEEDAGTLSVDSVRSGADGRASATWTLGPYIGEWTATATVGGLAPAVFHGTAGGPIHVRILTPAAGVTLDDVPLEVEVPHESDVKDVWVVTPDYTAELQLAGDSATRLRWKALLSFIHAAGPRRLRVFARDVRGNTAMAAVTVVHDAPMQINVLQPATPVLAGEVQVRATCFDDNPGGCRSLEAFVRVGGVETRIAQGVDSVSTTYSVAGVTEPSLQFVFRASNGFGATAAVERSFSVVHHSWVLVVSVDGALIDASPDWAIYVTDPPYYDFLRLLNVRTGHNQPLAAESNIGAEMPGSVTEAGAIVDFGPHIIAEKPEGVQEWGGSGIHETGGQSPLGRGRWAAFIGGFSRSCVVVRDDVRNRTVAETPDSLVAEGYDLAEDGTVALSASVRTGYCISPHPQLFVWRGGAPERLTSDTTTAVRGPVTDGTSFLFLREVRAGAGAAHRLMYLGAAGEQVLTPDLPATTSASFGTRPAIFPRTDYQLLNGWAAFQFPDASGAFHTFVRTPAGDVHPVWPGAPAGTRFVSVGPRGEVLLSANGTLYLSDSPHTTATDVGVWGTIKHAKWIDGKLYLVKDGGLYRLDRP
ncbi:Ig-like domain-containing protein [Longimicrobium sp.]|uniref:Ig-like domain-containing protein n=1 Tax=Longimicrobium sp. TaxID=2029185 RepID=UPI002C883587|nr:Ig-like domain-containing protein [Longimicrobium sp.]HSU18081.1 Ig-like domain-containing protein [Longimicrobium sp.]